MGRKTLESFPNKKPLPNRINIVLSRNVNIDNCIMVNSIKELFDKIKEYNSEDLFVIGGGQIYKELLPYCDKAYITKMENIFKADTSFPNLDKDDNWEIINKSEDLNYENIKFNFYIYKNKQKKALD